MFGSRLEKSLFFQLQGFPEMTLQEIVVLATLNQYRVAVVDSYAILYKNSDVLSGIYNYSYIFNKFKHCKVYKTLKEAISVARTVKSGPNKSLPITFFTITEHFHDLDRTAIKEPAGENSAFIDKIQTDMHDTAKT